MKKLFSILLIAVMLGTMLALPAASAGINKTVTGTEEIIGNEEYSVISIKDGGKLTVKSGAVLTVVALANLGGTVIIESGATVMIQAKIENEANSYLEISGQIKSKSGLASCNLEKKVIIKDGGMLEFDFVSDITCSNTAAQLSAYCVKAEEKHLSVRAAHNIADGVCSYCGKYGCDINGTEHLFENGKCTKCAYVCQNDFHNGVCPECGMVANASIGSVFSGGSLWLIIGVAAVAVAAAVVIVVVVKKKKKPAVVNDAPDINTKDDEQ